MQGLEYYNNTLPTIIEEESKPEYDNFDIHELEYTDTIGSGAFGQVKLCYFKNAPKNKFALKIIKLDSTNNNYQRNIKIVNNEIKILKYLKEDNFCNSFLLCYRGHSVINDTYYILTDYTTSYTPLTNYECLNIESSDEINNENKKILKLIQIFNNIYTAIRYLHTMKVVHLDIKPRNILYNVKDNNIKIIDFGGSCNYYESNNAPHDLVKCFDDNIYLYTEPFLDLRFFMWYQTTYIKNKQKIKDDDLFDNCKKADVWSFCSMLHEKIFGNGYWLFWKLVSYEAYNLKLAMQLYFAVYTKGINKSLSDNYSPIFDEIQTRFQICDKITELASNNGMTLPNIRDAVAPYDLKNGGTRLNFFGSKTKKTYRERRKYLKKNTKRIKKLVCRKNKSVKTK